jgi:hypothetical protein
VAVPLINAAKELSRLAIREGHATEDFSAIYDYLTTSHQTGAKIVALNSLKFPLD